jgi:glycosyltransferase involved in cell wall biosynthesis
MTNEGTRMMLFSHLCSDSHITGAEKLLLFMVQELSHQNECILVVPNEGLLAASARERGISTIILPYSLMLSMYHPGPEFEEILEQLKRDDSFRSLAKLLLSYRPEIIFTMTCLNALPAIAAKIIGIPVVWMITETMNHTDHIQKSVELINRNADWIIGISHSTLQSFQSEEVRQKTWILHPSWKMEELERETWASHRQAKRTQLELDDTKKVIGYISSDIYPNKGLDHFVHMAICLCDNFHHVHFFIIGKPTDLVYYQYCVDRIQESGYASRFHFASFEKRIQMLYPVLDIVVIPSLLNEGFGMTALEGLVFGKPVVTYRSGGLEEVLTSTGNEAFLVNKGDVEGLKEKVTTLIMNESLSAEVGKRNEQVVQEVFGIEPYRNRIALYLSEIRKRLKTKAPPTRVSSRDRLHGSSSLLIRGSDRTVYLLHSGVKYPFHSESIFKSWKYKFNQVIPVPDAAIKSITTGKPVIKAKTTKTKRRLKVHKKRSKKITYRHKKKVAMK